jgi:integrase
MVNGRWLRVSLGSNVAAAAEDRAIHMYILPALNGQEPAPRVPKPEPAAPACSTIGQVLATYRQISEGKLPARTIHNNLVTFRLVVRRGLGDDTLTDGAVDAQPASVLTGKLVSNLEDEMHRRGKLAGRNPEATKRSVNAYLRHARSVFKRTAMPRYAELGVVLPNLSEFMTRAVERAALPDRVPVDDKLISRTLKAAGELRAADRDAYIAWTLAFSSLRRGEVSRMQWSWMTRINGAPHIRLPADTKGKRECLIPIDERLWGELEEYRRLRQRGIDEAEEAFVLPSPRLGQGGPNCRLRATNVFRRVNQWMRRLGWKTNHTMHEMRALILSQIRDQFGLDTAQAMGRHRDQRTTVQSYVGTKSLQGVVVRLPSLNPHN